MNERQKILLAIVSFLAIVGLVVLLLLPSRSTSKSLDFYIHDANGNSRLEVGEAIEFVVNDPDGLEGKSVLWKMGNGDSVMGNTLSPCRWTANASSTRRYRSLT